MRGPGNYYIYIYIYIYNNNDLKVAIIVGGSRDYEGTVKAEEHLKRFRRVIGPLWVEGVPLNTAEL